MPYKEPERKRQWEREHREERNARRRKSLSGGGPAPSDILAPKSNTANEGKSDKVFIVQLAMGFAFVLFLLFAGWRFLRSRKAGEPAPLFASSEQGQ